MTRPRTVAFIAPSAAVPDTAVLDRAAQLAARGWRVLAADSCFERHLRFAGPDELRATELQRYATDPAVDLVIAARGGFGLTRILDRLDYAAIARAGKPICGYSDFTAFNLGLLSRARGVSFQGPSATDFGAPQPDQFMVEQFFAVLENRRHRLSFTADGPPLSVRGRLWGGNLAMLCALLGTPYFPRVRGGILFIEDVNEAAYRIERMVQQLAFAGVLQRQKAILLGSFDSVPIMPTDYDYSLASAVDHLRAIAGVPVIAGLPFGHRPRKSTLPVGASAELIVEGSSAQLSFANYPVLG